MVEIQCNEHDSEARIGCNHFDARNQRDSNEEQQRPSEYSVSVRVSCRGGGQNRERKINSLGPTLLNGTLVF